MRSRVARYTAAVAFLGIAVLVRAALDPWLGDRYALITLFGAVAFTAWVCGWVPGVLTSILGLVLVVYLFVPPRGALEVAEGQVFAKAVAYFVTCFAIIAAAAFMRRTHARLKASYVELAAERRRLQHLIQTQEKLLKSEAHLRRIIDNLVAFVAVLDRDGTLLEVGEPALRILNLKREDVIGHKFWDCPWWSERGQREKVRQWVIEAERGKILREDAVARIAGNQHLDVDCMVVPLRSAQGEVTHLIVSAVDISRRKRVETALLESDRRKDEFLATLAHELRNPLAPLRTGLQVLKATNSPETAQKVQEMMERQVRQLVHLVDDLLDLARVTQGKVELKKEPVVLQHAVESALETSLPLIEAASHDVTVRLPAEPVTIEADPTRLSQILSNVINNAAKYTPEGGSIEVSAETREREAVLRVKDTGIGIPAEMLPHVFDMFSQVSRARDRAQGGLGIGLSLVKRLVELHGGSIQAESDGRGKGSTFTVILPLARAFPAQRPLKLDTSVESRVARREKLQVLVVDDNVDAANTLVMLVQMFGHACRVAYSGPEALRIAREQLPDAIFLDIGMPGMNGYQVAGYLRSDRSYGSPMLIAVSGWGAAEDCRRSAEAGFDEHVTKPAEPQKIDTILQEVAASRYRTDTASA